MQKKWVIECVADYNDKNKQDAVEDVLKRFAVQAFAALLLLKEAQKPQMIFYSDDFIVGRNEIDVMARAVPADHVNATPLNTDNVSDELMEAMRNAPKK